MSISMLPQRVQKLSSKGVSRAASLRRLWGVAPQTEPDLTVPLEVSSPVPAFRGATPTQVTTLSNGLRVASSDLSVACTTVGVYVDTGSAYDQIPGTSHLLQYMAFKSSGAYSHLGVVRAGERMGAVASAVAGRENFVFQVDTMKDAVPEALEILADTVFNSRMLPWEVEDEKAAVKLELEEASKNPQQLLQDFAHSAAFGTGSALGSPLQCPQRNLPLIGSEELKAFAKDQFCPSRMVVTAAGYDHAELVNLAEATFGQVAAKPARDARVSTYVGGEYRESANTDDGLTHFALAFEGCSWESKDLVPMCVLNTMMGGGASFSAGGPGKGMYTRLYQNILNQHAFVHAASVFSSFYNGTGIFGVYGATQPDCMGQLVGALCDEMKKMAVSVSETELSRAKNQLTSSLMMNLESRPVLFEDIGRQVLTYGARSSPEQLAERIAGVSAKDLINLSKKMLKTPVTVAVYGDTTAAPRYDQISEYFKA